MVSMTDEELIKRLRLQSEHVPADTIFDAAADRIEKLVESIKNLLHLWATVAVNREVSEGKLEKAVEALRLVVTAKGLTDPTEYGYDAIVSARAILAELEKTE